VLYLYILQFCNTFTQEIIREETYEKPDIVGDILESRKNGSSVYTFLIDKQMRILKADFVTYKVYPDGNDMIYKLFFRVQQVEAPL
jgi:hypothetical protein